MKDIDRLSKFNRLTVWRRDGERAPASHCSPFTPLAKRLRAKNDWMNLRRSANDRGAFTLSNKLEVLVSDRANGTASFNDWLLRYHGKKRAAPQRTTYQPNRVFRNWHLREFFRGEVRELPTTATHPSSKLGHR